MGHFVVVGASGFLGQYLTKHLLNQNHNVVAVLRKKKETISSVFSHKNCEVRFADMEDYSSLELSTPVDCVFYLTWAGNSGATRADTQTQLSNLKGLTDCLSAFGAKGCQKFVATGTISEKLVLDEGLSLKNQAMLYASTKHSAYLIASVLCQKYNMDFTWLQLANIYGFGNMTGNLTSYTIETLLKGEVPSFSSGKVLQDFMYVEDCVAGITLAGEKSLKKKLYYLGTGQPQPLKEYLYQIRDTIDPNLPLGLGQRQDDGTEYPKEWFDVSPFVAETGFSLDYTFAEGMKKTIEKRQSGGMFP